MKRINDISRKHISVNHKGYQIHETKTFIVLTHVSSSDPRVESKHLFVFILRKVYSMLYNSLCSFGFPKKKILLQSPGGSLYKTKSTLGCPSLFTFLTIDILYDLRDICDLRPQLLMRPATLCLLWPATPHLSRPVTCALFSWSREQLCDCEVQYVHLPLIFEVLFPC